MSLTELQVKQLNNMNAAAQRAQLGTLLGILGPVGDVYWLDPTNGSDTLNDGTAPASAFASLETAEAALTANQNDVLVYIAGTTSLNMQAALTWDKSYTHFVGYCAPSRIEQRARIFQKSTLTGASPLLTISASSCIFKDLYIFQGVNDATSLINVQVTGSRNYFENVHFAGAGHTAQAVDGGASLNINGGSANTFFKCTIGTDTAVAAAGVSALTFGPAIDAAHNYFDQCTFRVWANSTAVNFVETTITGVNFDNVFDNCIFINRNAAGGTSALASAFEVPGSTTGYFLLKDCMFWRVTKLDANDSLVVIGNMNAVTAADLSGVALPLRA
jgi:hypothetical protein